MRIHRAAIEGGRCGRWCRWLLLPVWLQASPLFAQPPQFVEETAIAGIDHSYTGGDRFVVGGGVAVLDCDEDGFADLFLAGGAGEAGVFRNLSRPGGTLRFQQVDDSGGELRDVLGAYPLDVDNDGHQDLMVLRLGENIVLRGSGDCLFERANQRWCFDGGDAWSTAFSARWESGSRWPTLAIGNYVDYQRPGSQAPVCDDNLLYRPADEAYREPLVLAPGYCTLSMLFTDWNRSGEAALRVSNDRHYSRDGEEQLWRVEADKPPRPYTREQGWRRLRIWGMGIASADIDGDGYPEYLLTSMGDNKLRRLADGAAGPSYEDQALRRGVTAHRPFAGGDSRPSTAWHAEFGDVNNDGLIDLFITKGNVGTMQKFATKDPNNLLLGSTDGRFSEVAAEAGILDFGRSRGASLSDFNLDGQLDLVVVNRDSPLRIWRNQGPGGNWLAVSLSQPGPNRDAIGAWIEVESDGRVQVRELTVGGGHAGGSAGWRHFGLGQAGRARIRVRWPDGSRGDWLLVFANRYARILRDARLPRVWRPEYGSPW